MRSLSIFIKILVYGVLAVVIAFLAGREILLAYSTIRLNNEVSRVTGYLHRPQAYIENCISRFPELSAGAPLEGFQIRFMDDTHYSIDAVCQFHGRDPIQIGKGSLAPYAKRVPGYSGLFFGLMDNKSKLAIEVNGRTSVITSGKDGDTLLPVTSCAGWGYSCCDSTFQVSSGLSAGNQVIDCAGQCFQQCNSRPLVLAFRSDPAVDKDNVATLGQTGTITMTFVVSDPDGTVKDVMVDFGDGKSEHFTQIQGAVTHTYACKPGFSHCRYSVKLTVTDDQGNTSPDLANAQMTIQL